MEKLGLVVLGMIAVVPALRPWLQCDARSTLNTVARDMGASTLSPTSNMNLLASAFCLHVF